MYFDQKEFGKRLKETRLIRGMTQEELAELLNINKQHVSRMERGVTACSIDLLIELSCHLQVSTDYLLMGKEPNTGGQKEQILEVISTLSAVARNL